MGRKTKRSGDEAPEEKGGDEEVQFVGKTEAAELPVEELERIAAIPVWEDPAALGRDWTTVVPVLTIRVKQLDHAVNFHGYITEPGDFVGYASDGGRVVLSERELRTHYRPA